MQIAPDTTLPLLNSWVWALAVCLFAAALEGVLAGTGVKQRFSELSLPRHSPPLWAWAIIGLSYYALFVFVLHSLFSEQPVPGWSKAGVGLVICLLMMNAGWNWLFFRSKHLWLSLLYFIPYGVAAIALATVLARIQSPLLAWYLVYTAYLLYAAWWGYGIWQLNTAPRSDDA
jgi:tryptophan-rich sensory protein